MEKLIINPSEVRGLGNIVSPKILADFVGNEIALSASIDSTYGTVYTGSYRTGSKITPYNNPKSVLRSESSFLIRGYLKDSSDTAISGAAVYLEVNGVVVSSYTTLGTGAFSFTVNTEVDVDVYHVRVRYNGSGSVAGCFLFTCVYVVDSVDSVEVFSEKQIMQSGQTSVLASRVLGSDGKPVKGVEVKFYKE